MMRMHREEKEKLLALIGSAVLYVACLWFIFDEKRREPYPPPWVIWIDDYSQRHRVKVWGIDE